MAPIRWGFAGFILLSVAAVLYLAWPTKPPAIDTTQLIAEATAKVEAQFKADLAQREAMINDYKSRLLVSESRYKALSARYDELQKGKESVTVPETNTEIRDRFTALGYPPLSGK